MPIVGWLQILVVIALSELWRYEPPGGGRRGVGVAEARGLVGGLVWNVEVDGRSLGGVNGSIQLGWISTFDHPDHLPKRSPT